MDPEHEYKELNQEKEELKLPSFRELLSGTILTGEKVTRQFPFIVFMVILAFLYIGNRYHAERLTRRTIQYQEELNELRAESISTSSELMFMSRQSQVLQKLSQKGLPIQDNRVPPLIIHKD